MARPQDVRYDGASRRSRFSRTPAPISMPSNGSTMVQANDGKYGVFVVSNSESGSTARLRSVEIGRVIGTDISIVKGLASHDEVITTGATLLKDGQRVEVLK